MAELAPKNGEFLEGKLWFYRKGSSLTLGLTNTAVEEIGSVESIEFPSEGEDFEKGDIVVTIAGSQGQVEVMTPASGVIQEVNEAAQKEPEMVSDDPLEQGWLVKLEMQDPTDLREVSSRI